MYPKCTQEPSLLPFLPLEPYAKSISYVLSIYLAGSIPTSSTNFSILFSVTTSSELRKKRLGSRVQGSPHVGIGLVVASSAPGLTDVSNFVDSHTYIYVTLFTRIPGIPDNPSSRRLSMERMPMATGKQDVFRAPGLAFTNADPPDPLVWIVDSRCCHPGAPTASKQPLAIAKR
jgi:hypothetical protein